VTAIVTASERQIAAATWLAAAAPVPRLALADWERSDLALLPTGVQFGVVAVPGAEVRAAARTEQQGMVDRFLRGVLTGPVFCYDRHDTYYALVPANTARAWKLPDVECMGLGQTVAVPRPGLTRKDGGRAFWAVPLGSPAVLCPPRRVVHLILAGRRPGATCG
jgi:hypothetical protein